MAAQELLSLLQAIAFGVGERLVAVVVSWSTAIRYCTPSEVEPARTNGPVISAPFARDPLRASLRVDSTPDYAESISLDTLCVQHPINDHA
jgi:hypothetical protein